jgi:hypothetical protein
LEFVALGVPAEVVVIVEDEDPRVLSGLLSVKVCGGQTADAAANNDEIIILPGVNGVSEGTCAFAVAQAMSKGERTVMIPADAHLRRRIVVRGFFRSKFIEGAGGQQSIRCDIAADKRSPDTHGNAVQEIAPGNFPVHP